MILSNIFFNFHLFLITSSYYYCKTKIICSSIASIPAGARPRSLAPASGSYYRQAAAITGKRQAAGCRYSLL
jgi:hypothetical protein